MPLFHFDIRYGHEPWSDDEYGAQFADADEARAQAIDLIGALAREHLRTHRDIAVRVRDGDPEPIQTLRMSLRTEERA